MHITGMKHQLSKLALFVPSAILLGGADIASNCAGLGMDGGLSTIAAGQTVRVLPSPSVITSISDDGSVVAGVIDSLSPFAGHPFLESGGVITRITAPLYGTNGVDDRSPWISGDGHTLFNSGVSGTGYLIPTNGGTATPLPLTAGLRSYGGGLSYDGSVVVGTDLNQSGTSHVGWRWTAAGGRQNLPFNAGAVSGDGNTVLGGDGTATGVVWHNGTLTHLQSPPEANNPFNGVRATNFDGNIIVGYSGNYATVWHNSQGTILPLVSGFRVGTATDTNDDGTVVVGVTSSDTVNNELFVWTPSRGTETIVSYLFSYGVDLSAYRFATSISAPSVSSDGRTFGLTARLIADNSLHAIVVTIPTPATALLVSLALASIRRRR